MSDYRFLAKDAVSSFLAEQAKEQRLLVPCEKKAVKTSVVFEEWHEGQPFTLQKATVPPKASVLPQCETLLHYTKTKDPDNPENVTLTLDDTPFAVKTLVFGARPCDAKGIAVLDRPYYKGLYKDPYYAARRELLTIVTITCQSGCESCFCHWLGGGPSSPEGSDVLLTEIEDGYVMQGITEKGKAFLAKTRLPDGNNWLQVMQEARKKAFASLEKAPDLKEAPKKIAEHFDDLAFWSFWTERCLSCGACTYFCPTCYCFTITDEGDPFDEHGGKRLRSWDTCMSSLFTREASGHNPRQTKAERMRNRVSHKFATYPENWGVFSCSGCGRCVNNCPVGLDIRAIVLAALNDSSAKTPSTNETGKE